MRRTTALATVLAAVLATACATPPMPAPSGFLGGPDAYASMRPSTRVRGVWVAGHTGRALRQLQLVQLPPIEVVPAPGSGITEATEPLARELAKTLRDEIVAALGKRYPVVQNAGPHVMLVQAAITDVTVEDGRLVRGATMEAEIRDSRSRERLAAVVATDAVHGGGATALDVARGWAQALRARIDEAHLGDEATLD